MRKSTETDEEEVLILVADVPCTAAVRTRRRAIATALALASLLVSVGAWRAVRSMPFAGTTEPALDSHLIQKGMQSQCTANCTHKYHRCLTACPYLVADPLGAAAARMRCSENHTKCTTWCAAVAADATIAGVVTAACKGGAHSSDAPRGAEDPIEVSMAKMASDTYKGGVLDFLVDHHDNISWVKKMVQSRRSGLTGLGRDKVELFQRGKSCALAFSGSDDFEDAEADINALTVNRCGVAIHQGFMSELEVQTNTSQFVNEFAPFLKSSECAGGVYVVGHSLGGALASIFAGCSTRPDAPESIQGIKVEGLYTFGAPGVSKPTGQPGGEPSGRLGPRGATCFKGKRFWNTAVVGAVGQADPIPAITAPVGLLHPMVQSVNLNAPFVWSRVERREYDCTSDEAKLKPAPSIGIAPNMLYHAWCLYENRVRAVY
mmetsp:Transcript_103377/g.287840  ORF Transcript_103377/g.287840 Transcript_103377/m.287840 type:complete len:433 (-) Transcript_103377:154-1452(-)